MNTLYNWLIYLTSSVLKIAAQFNPKLKKFVSGRKEVMTFLRKNIQKTDRIIWLHTASLGEFEQGLPLIETLKLKYPSHKILVTFFSPSGYEVKKNSPVADIITYLPLDTKKNAKTFIQIVNPEMAFFVKYEFWPNFLYELKKHQIPTYLISGIFRKSQIFLNRMGFTKKWLHTFTHFFVQTRESKSLLKSIGFNNTTISGDTRFDRVIEISQRNNKLEFIEEFLNSSKCIVFGSSWPEDEAIYCSFINNSKNQTKYIIAPHNIKPTEIDALQKQLTVPSLRYSEREGKTLSNYNVIIIDTIGLLTKIYSYATIAYVGGGMGKTGLHNILEPAVFGIPVVIGKNYSKFNEALDLVSMGGVISISNEVEFNHTLSTLLKNHKYTKELGSINSNYIQKNSGSTKRITDFIEKTILFK